MKSMLKRYELHAIFFRFQANTRNSVVSKIFTAKKGPSFGVEDT